MKVKQQFMSENQGEKESNRKNLNKIPKIHRRKNKEIAKQFPCTENCGKAYGSYAALYTHIRNKHGNIKPPQMKTDKPKIGRKGRPQTKQIQKMEQINGECRICSKLSCECIERFDSQQKNQIIETMADDSFINFTNQIGNLSKTDGVVIVRSTEEDFVFYSPKQIEDLIKEFSIKYGREVSLSKKLSQFLSFSSRYWNPETIVQLYFSIFTIKNFLNIAQSINFIKTHPKDFSNIIKCIQNDGVEFQTFASIVKNI